MESFENVHTAVSLRQESLLSPCFSIGFAHVMITKTVPIAKTAPLTVLTQGSYRLHTKVLAYVQPQNPILKIAELYDVDLVVVDNLNRSIFFEVKSALENSAVAVLGAGEFGQRIEVVLVLIDHGLNEAEKATLSGLVMNDAPLVVGPRAAGDFTWQLKAEANSRGRIFEVAESQSVLEKLFATSLEATRRRISLRWQKPAETLVASPGSDDLASLPGVLEVTHSLRSERGRLDAEKIRELFTLSRAELARITGVQEETIRQTSDSERLQISLRPFDRTARLLVLNTDRAKFATWLNAPNTELDDRTPLELIREGRIEVVDTLVHDIITNRGR